jgi:large subunit ribosomal protein L15
MLHSLRPASGSRRTKKRVARGPAAGGGTTAGRGGKGQQSRTGKGRRFGFEGGQTPLLRRQPKSNGFIRPRRVHYETINISAIEEVLPAGSYTAADLRSKGLLSSNKPVKLLAYGSVSKRYTLEVHAASKAARKAIETAGGTLNVVDTR